jgi:hypothetical protein
MSWYGAEFSLQRRIETMGIKDGCCWIDANDPRNLPVNSKVIDLLDWACEQANQYQLANTTQKFGIVSVGPMVIYKMAEKRDYIQLDKILKQIIETIPPRYHKEVGMELL